MNDSAKLIKLERKDLSPALKALFVNDFKKLAEEYFECDGVPELDVNRADDEYSVCIIFRARRIKKVNQIL